MSLLGYLTSNIEGSADGYIFPLLVAPGISYANSEYVRPDGSYLLTTSSLTIDCTPFTCKRVVIISDITIG